MRRADLRRRLALAMVGMLTLAACSAAATPAPTAKPTAAPSTAASAAAPTATALPGTKTFTVAGPGPGPGNVLFVAAQDALRTQGYTITTSSINTPELVIEGVSKGTFSFGSGSIATVMAAVAKGAALRVIADRTGNEWVLYAKNEIDTCAKLAGKQMAVTSLGSAATAMTKGWIAKNCAGTTPTYLVIANSPDRAKALIANVIDASPLQIADGVPLMTDPAAAGRFRQLANFVKDLPDLLVNSTYVNLDFARDNPGTVVAVVKAIVTEFRKSADDPNYLKTVIQKYVTEYDAKYIDTIIKSYQELKVFDVNGGLSNEKLTFAAKFYGPTPEGTGNVPSVLANSAFGDLTYLNVALNELGRR